MSRSAELLVQDILDRIARIERAVGGFDRARFLSDEKTIDAVVRSLEVIGEAASRLPAAFTETRGDIPWKRIVGLRHRIVHAYFEVDLDLVWTIVVQELPELQRRLVGASNDAGRDGLAT